MKRYLLTAEFTDKDFDLGFDGERYWTKRGAIRAWHEKEQGRIELKIRHWRYVLIDTKTDSVIRPLGETQESPRSP